MPVVRTDVSLEDDLRSALSGDRLEIAYQPIVRSSDGTVVGVEALLRWDRPGHGPVEPAVVIEIAERTGMIHELGLWVLFRSCLDHRWWSLRNLEHPLVLAVNVSAAQLTAPDFAERVLTVLIACGTSPRDLVLELTESVLMEDADDTLRVLDELRRAGIRLALDDFGTGYSSFSYLNRLPIDIIKVDRQFISELSSPKGSRIVDSIIHLAHDLDLEIVAEGVETASQDAAVLQIGCDFKQGFFVAEPQSASSIGQLMDMITARERRHTGGCQVPRAGAGSPGWVRAEGRMSQTRVVELSGPADDAFVRLVRTASVSFASQAGLPIDPCDELRMAADEACRMLCELGAGSLGVTFVEAAGLLTLSVRPDIPLIFQPAPESALILKTMTDRFFLAEGDTIVLEKALSNQA